MRWLVLLGCGGHGRSVADVALASGFERLLFVDPRAQPGETILGFAVENQMPQPGEPWEYIPCAGDNRKRQEQFRDLAASRLRLASVISPHATIGCGAEVDSGCFVGHHAHVGPLARIGAGCIINTGAIVEHECIVGECSHIAVGACVAGRTRIGDRVFIGAGGIVIDSISVASDITIGAGGVVAAPLETPGTYVGVPVRRVQ